jgi:hypothetical protein
VNVLFFVMCSIKIIYWNNIRKWNTMPVDSQIYSDQDWATWNRHDKQ